MSSHAERPDVRVYCLSGTRLREHELDDFEFEAVLRNNQVGTWALTTKYAGTAPDWLRFGGYGSGVALTVDGQTMMVGVIEERIIDESAATISLTVKGRDAMVFLEDRWVDPMEGVGGPSDYSDQAYDEQTGLATTLMRHYVTSNMSSVRSDRVTPNFVLSPNGDAGLGGTMKVRARFDNLLTLLQDIAATASPVNVGLSFQVVESISTPGRLEFDVRQPRDRRSEVIFDRRLHNVSRATMREYGPTVNAVIVAGQGEAEARQLQEYTDDSSISRYARRIERFVDRRDTSDAEVHAQKAMEVLKAGDGGFEYLLDEVLDNAPYRWGRDYDLGDLVTVYVAGVQGEGVVSEIRLSITGADGMRVTPLIGPIGATFSDVETRQLAQLEERVSYLERVDSFGSIKMGMHWRGTPEELPVGWRVSDGTTVNGYTVTDMRGRVAIGATINAGAYPLGATGGAATLDLEHSHTGGTLYWEHEHEVDIDHDHPNHDTSNAESDTGGVQFSAGGVSHQHQFDMPALGVTIRVTDGPINSTWDGSTGSALGEVSILPPYMAWWFIERVPG